MQLRIIFIAALLTLQGVAATPIKTTLTDTKGRVIEGTILAKSNNAITFQPKGNASKTFEIQLDTLSTATQTLVQNLDKDADNKNSIDKGIKTLIEPGSKAILAIPFEAQKRGGICAAAATINILKFMKPTLEIDQEKLFSLFDAGRAGASPQQVMAGIAAIGFTGNLVHPQAVDREQLLADIKANLDAGRPMIAASKSHAIVLFGYDNTVKNGVFYLWDQKGPHNKRATNGMPNGTEEIAQSRFMTTIVSVMFIYPSK